MTTSSAQSTYTITLDDTLLTSNTISIGPSVTSSVTIPTSYSYASGSGIGTISITDLTSEYAVSWGNTEWVDCFPEWSRIEKMCEEYPGLKIAFEKFKTTYHLVKDDYDTPKDQRKVP